MDYSLLLIILNNPLKETDDHSITDIFSETNFKRIIFKSKDNKYIYNLGIIDFLQNFNIKKLLENKYKRIIHSKDAHNISAVDPFFYCSRFYDFMRTNVLKYHDDEKLNVSCDKLNQCRKY